MLDALRAELFDLPDLAQFVRVFVRLSAAVILGGLLGYEREREGKAAGLRTHMLVALGAALFTIGPLEAGMSTGDLSRVFQGIVTGIGFIGAGTILKRTDEREIQGLTTAANLWFTAAVGMAVGLGHLWLPALGVVFALIILTVLETFERRIPRGR
jgi:putative Mg2+ transporter-C (MgtC) family protein